MSDRFDALQAFAQKNGCDSATMHMIAGDASNRKYYRAQRAGRSVVLMDADPNKGEDTKPFVEIAAYLRSCELSAPEIYAQDEGAGFLAIEDLGDALFAKVIPQAGSDEALLYHVATEVVLHLNSQTPPNLKHYNAEAMAPLAALAWEWYKGADAQEFNDASQTLTQVFSELDAQCSVLIQRDYHAENLLWLPERAGLKRVGLLDFQDAMIGHPAYDLVSILQDARRDVPKTLQTEMLAYFCKQSGTDHTQAYHLLGLQRNLRILGVFARLSLRDGKPHYVDYIPRVWQYITDNLAILEDAQLSALVLNSLPAPTPDHLQSLKDRAA